ncbi:hypothetical protein DRO69_01985 [Candidatus Bathyarchaeota archaeon]|nr:MAG: hypothetical protein DRO69_01985 [Candidatus Bathyarchaeota archaeon]
MRTLLFALGFAMIGLALITPLFMATVTYESPIPQGKFYIDGVEATEDSVHYTTDPELNVTFVATAHGDIISNVLIKRYDETEAAITTVENYWLTEIEPDQKWHETITLPHPGTYILRGFVLYNQDSDSIQLMSIVGEWTGTEGTFTGDESEKSIGWSKLQMGLLITGGVLVVLGFLMPKRRR